MIHDHKKVPAPIVVGSSEVLEYRYMENTTSRYAFWAGWLEHGSTHWFFCWRFGKIGAAGRTGKKKFPGQWAARSAMHAKLNQRMDHDYETVWEWEDAMAVEVEAACSLPPTPPPPVTVVRASAPKIRELEQEFSVDDALDVLWGW